MPTWGLARATRWVCTCSVPCHVKFALMWPHILRAGVWSQHKSVLGFVFETWITSCVGLLKYIKLKYDEFVCKTQQNTS